MNNLNINDVNKENNCCGCTACYAVCPVGAITMEENEKGFISPKINAEKCTHCGLCVNVCDFKNVEKNDITPTCYAVRHRDDAEVATSRSGAFFISLAEFVLNNNGVVIGCALVDNVARHIVCKTKNELNLLKGSKYVQSTKGDIFNLCIQYLKEDKYVLFSGTPCEMHGLIKLLKAKKVNTEKFISCDLVCHGVPSPGVFSEYIKYLEKKYKGKITNYNFRDKEKYGWADHLESFVVKNKKRIQISYSNFFYNNVFRESCFNCPYTTIYRQSDFTIADFWGIDSNYQPFNDDKGASLVMVRTDKAKSIFEQLKQLETIRFAETDLDNSIKLQVHLFKPAEKEIIYDKFWNLYAKDKQKCVKKYVMKVGLKIRTQQNYKFFKRKVKDILKKFFK